LAKEPTKKTPQDEAERQEDVFLREVEDAVRQDDLKNFWGRYGLWLVGLIVVGLSGLAGWIFYQNDQAEKAGTRSEEFIVAVDSIRKENLDGAAKALETLEKAEQGGYAAAAMLLRANIALEKDDSKAAIASFGKIAADENVPQSFRDLALLRQTAAEYDSLKPQQVVDRLKGMAVPGNPWFGSAGEMVAIAYRAMDKDDLAGTLYAQIAEDETVPSTMRSRAQQMAGLLGVDAVKPAEDSADDKDKDKTQTDDPKAETSNTDADSKDNDAKAAEDVEK